MRSARDQVELGVVGDDRVHARAAVDSVVAGTADQEVGAAAAVDRVVAAHVVEDRSELAEHAALVSQARVVAEHGVLARAHADEVVARAAYHDVVAIADRDHVAAGVAREGRDDAGEDRRPGERGQEVDPAVSSHHRVVAVARGDGVVGRPADDEGVAAALGDRVVAADSRVDARDLGQRPQHAVGPVARTAVTENRGGLRLGARTIKDATAVADDDVAAGAAVDGVVAFAAEDHERQRRALRVDRVAVVRATARAEQAAGRDGERHEARVHDVHQDHGSRGASDGDRARACRRGRRHSFGLTLQKSVESSFISG